MAKCRQFKRGDKVIFSAEHFGEPRFKGTVLGNHPHSLAITIRPDYDTDGYSQIAEKYRYINVCARAVYKLNQEETQNVKA